ncbi:hypothetical protein D3C72_2120540 [compost metagenome]
MCNTRGRSVTLACFSSCVSAAWLMMLRLWSSRLRKPSALLPVGLAEMSTAITMSAPISRAAITGTGLVSPPST